MCSLRVISSCRAPLNLAFQEGLTGSPEHRPFELGCARCVMVFPVSVVMGAAVPAAVCRWGLRWRCPGGEGGGGLARCVCERVNVYIYICVCVCEYMYTYIHTYIHIHIYISGYNPLYPDPRICMRDGQVVRGARTLVRFVESTEGISEI